MNQEQYEYEIMRELELRDYFAAKAMQSMIVNLTGSQPGIDYVPEASYKWADAMMEARKNG